MAKTIADFEDFIFQYAPDAPTSIIHHAIRTSLVYFMQNTQSVKDFAQFPLVAKTPDYIIDAPECRVVVEVLSVKVGCSGTIPDATWYELERGVDYEVDLLNDGWPSIVLSEAPEENCHNPLNQDLSVEYAWSISHDDCEVPDFIYDRYMQYIIDGALAILYATPGQEWTNLNYAMQLRSTVEEAYKTIKSKSRRRSPQPMKFRRATSTIRNKFAMFRRT